ncbi:ROK family protein [Erysipelothrix sp. HDW6C]|uniref:ROK family protein n=1 Tax=Erysipelothrix sp. HDW6C TaxID=2714930 RepID=UPI00140A36FD|nr:ROK family protein [Erysipelothrix sp. HDW6C]QIK70203.1 ROK family protein [Erysipelothrix sp. HDW6C]
MRKFIGIDLGGTNVRVAVVTELGEITEEIKRPSQASEGPEVVLNNIVEMIYTLSSLSEVEGIGIGIPGPVDTEKGSVTLSTNLNGFTGYPVVDYLKEYFKMPIYMDNDANVAGLAEALVGAGKGRKVVYYVTHSTGIGGALVVDGKVVSGRKGYAGEIGNIVIDRDRVRRSDVNTLNAGAVENEASGSAMVRKAQETIDRQITSAFEIFKLYEKNDPKAVKLVDEMSYDIGQLMATIAHVVDPHVFVIGGGVTSSRDLYWDKMKAAYQDLVHPHMRDTEFVLASLDEPGVIGAAMLCYSQEA